MNQNKIEVTPETYIRKHTFLYFAFLAGPLAFTALAYFIVSEMDGEGLDGDGLTFVFDLALPIMGILGVMAGFYLFNYRMKSVQKEMDLKKKLEIHSSSSILRIALVQGPAFFSIVAFLLTGKMMYLVIAMALIAVLMYLKPTKYRVVNDLDLTDKEARELVG